MTEENPTYAHFTTMQPENIILALKIGAKLLDMDLNWEVDQIKQSIQY